MIRVFPRRTKATPDDDEVRVGAPGLFDRGKGQQIDISCTFIWDKPECERLEILWRKSGYNPLVGGPAYGSEGNSFTPGRYLKKGYVITSRGCPRKCGFCLVPRREGKLREIEITDGWNVLDNNLLACTKQHINRVFNMLKRQPKRPIFSGGLDSRLLRQDIADKLFEIKTGQLFLAYDESDDWEPLVTAARILFRSGFTPEQHKVFAYVLIGYQGDTRSNAEKRLQATLGLGVIPFAMLYQDGEYRGDIEWRLFQRRWCRPQLIFKREPALRG
ncbi:MAG: hypothetical protein ABII09_03685 [Planctomycetota bacterium]